MTSLSPTQVHHTVENDLGGTQRPSGELGWGGLALFEGGNRFRKVDTFSQLNQLMEDVVVDSAKIAKLKVGGPSKSDRSHRAFISRNQRTRSVVNQVGGLEITSTSDLSKPNDNVVFVDQEVPGGAN